jgi:hypothetical protein
MKRRLNIGATVLRRLKREAARQGRTISELTGIALRLILVERQEPDLPPLPTFNSGGELVDISDRNALYSTMETK